MTNVKIWDNKFNVLLHSCHVLWINMWKACGPRLEELLKHPEKTQKFQAVISIVACDSLDLRKWNLITVY